jgi:DNA-directed RNA polymerase alpha subunit
LHFGLFRYGLEIEQRSVSRGEDDPEDYLSSGERARRNLKSHLTQAEPEKLFGLTIEHLNFSWATLIKLRNAHISYIGELVQQTAEELKKADLNNRGIE